MKKIYQPPILMILVSCIFLTANSQQGKWEVLKTKNDVANRSECSMVAIKDKLYLIGGDGRSKAVESLDTKTLQWTKLSDAPVVMHHFQAVAYGNRIFALEAFSEGAFPDQVPMANVYIYNTDNDQWQKGAEMPVERRRAGAGAVEYNGKLYLVAGIQHGHSSGTTNMFDVYDPGTNTWTPLIDAPHIRDHCSAAVVKDKLYVVGGRNTSYHEPGNFMSFFAKTVTDVDCYDFKTNQWSTLPEKLPLGSGGGAVVNFNNKLYYMGGERATATEPNASRKNTYYLDPSGQGEWIETDSLNFARNGTAAAVINNHIYLAAGSGGPPPNGNRGMPPQGFNQQNRPDPDSAKRNGLNPGPPMIGGNNNKLIIEVFSLK